ncbi:MAG: 3-isopropylmalate dehydrogenase [Alphaproteobacteria bacterium]|nr:3-isopropylmalate dehydrogenase [Alphaproteobacteria bacterium]
MTKTYKLKVLAGDGIGPEIIKETYKIIDWINATSDIIIETSEGLIGGCSIDKHNSPLTDETLDECKSSDAILMGAVGGPKWDNVAYDIRPEAGLLKLRKSLDLYANLRPAKVLDALIESSALKPEIVKGLDILIVRELTSGLYFGTPRAIEDLDNGEQKGIDTCTYTTSEIQRVARVAFETARKRSNKVTSCDKANVLATSKLWRQTVTELHKNEYSDVELDHMYVDNCAMQLVRNPRQFDVIVTDNLFGDILSDESAMLTGSLGMLPSASMGGEDMPYLYEPIHGSAPDIAGKNIANPLATILSMALALRYSFDSKALAQKIEEAVSAVLADNLRTSDIMSEGCKEITTSEMGSAIVAKLNG